MLDPLPVIIKDVSCRWIEYAHKWVLQMWRTIDINVVVVRSESDQRPHHWVTQGRSSLLTTPTNSVCRTSMLIANFTAKGPGNEAKPSVRIPFWVI